MRKWKDVPRQHKRNDSLVEQGRKLWTRLCVRQTSQRKRCSRRGTCSRDGEGGGKWARKALRSGSTGAEPVKRSFAYVLELVRVVQCDVSEYECGKEGKERKRKGESARSSSRSNHEQAPHPGEKVAY